MSVRRLHPNQPATFAFTPDNAVWATATIAKYPPGKQASAVIPLLMRAQEQHAGWLPEPAIRVVAEMLDMAYIRVYEIATFYTQFQLGPVGKKAHVQVCGTTPCMLRGAEDLKKVCKSRIHHDQFHLSADGNFSWEEVECAGACANAPMVQIFSDTYEDLTPELLEKVLDGFANGQPPKPGSQTGRIASAPLGGLTALTDPALYDGSGNGAWKKRLADVDAKATADAAAKAATDAATAKAASATTPTAPPSATPAADNSNKTTTAVAATASAAAATVAGLMSKPATAAPASAIPTAATASSTSNPGTKPAMLTAPRDGKADDLGLIWGVADKLEAKLNAVGIWHFDQVAKWTPAEILWVESNIEGMQGRVARDRWLEQCAKLASGWRPEGNVGERPKG